MKHKQASPEELERTRSPHGREEESDRPGPRRGVSRARKSRDSTSINPDKRSPIDPRMPDLPPA